MEEAFEGGWGSFSFERVNVWMHLPFDFEIPKYITLVSIIATYTLTDTLMTNKESVPKISTNGARAKAIVGRPINCAHATRWFSPVNLSALARRLSSC